VQPIRSAWNNFYASLDSKHSETIEQRFLELYSSFPADPNLEALSDTDLEVYPDDCPDSDLPATGNGIKQNELDATLRLYREFQQKITIESTDVDLVQLINRDIRMILSRPLGRKLIRLINAKPCQLVIRKTSDVPISGRLKRGPYLITYSDQEYLLFQKIPTEKMRAAPSPSFIHFAHELIHFYHVLYDIAQDNQPDPLLNTHLFTNKLECLTITGKTPSEEVTQDISENAIRAEFGLPERHSLLAFAPKTTMKDRVIFSLYAGSTADLESLFCNERLTPDVISLAWQILSTPNLSPLGPQFMGQLYEYMKRNPHVIWQEAPNRTDPPPSTDHSAASLPQRAASDPEHSAPNGSASFPLREEPSPDFKAPETASLSKHPADCPGCPHPAHQDQTN
jgi:hypothetical protein